MPIPREYLSWQRTLTRTPPLTFTFIDIRAWLSIRQDRACLRQRWEGGGGGRSSRHGFLSCSSPSLQLSSSTSQKVPSLETLSTRTGEHTDYATASKMFILCITVLGAYLIEMVVVLIQVTYAHDVSTLHSSRREQAKKNDDIYLISRPDFAARSSS